MRVLEHQILLTLRPHWGTDSFKDMWDQLKYAIKIAADIATVFPQKKCSEEAKKGVRNKLEIIATLFRPIKITISYQMLLLSQATKFTDKLLALEAGPYIIYHHSAVPCYPENVNRNDTLR